MRRLITVLLALVLVLAFCGATFHKAEKERPTYEDVMELVEEGKEEEAIDALKQIEGYEDLVRLVLKAENIELASIENTVGETTVVVDDFECQIKEVNWYSASDFDFDCIEHEEGYEYIVIVLSEKNTTDVTKNAPMLNLLSADGQQCVNKVALSLYKNQYKINFGATMADSTAEAYVIYQIPSGAESFKLQILSNEFGSSSDYIVFDRNDIQ